MSIDLGRWKASLTAFDGWLENQSSAASRAWLRRLMSPDYAKVEAAVAEAVTWDYLACRSDDMRLAEDPGKGGPDFEFSVGGQRFFVEVANMSTVVVTTKCGMADSELKSGFYGLLTSSIRSKIRSKFKQAYLAPEGPLLVAVTTLHQNASCLCMDRRAVEFAMGSPPRIACKWNPLTGDAEGDTYQSTDLKQSVFLSPNPVGDANGKPVAEARYEPISGFLLGGFGLKPWDTGVYGGLNPEAAHPFDPVLLPDVPLCRFRDWPAQGELAFSWSVSEQEQLQSSRRAVETHLRRVGMANPLD